MLFSWCVIVVYVAVCEQFAGVHKDAKPIQCHGVVRGGCKEE